MRSFGGVGRALVVLLLALAGLFVTGRAEAQFFVRPVCTSIANPQLGWTCSETSTLTIKQWNGSIWAGASGGAIVNGLTGPVSFLAVANQTSVVTGANSITYGTAQNISASSTPTFVNAFFSALSTVSAQCVQYTSAGGFSLSGAGCGGGGGAGVSALNGLTGGLTLAPTANQVNVASVGTTITLSTPQDIATTSNVRFGSLGLGVAAPGSNQLTVGGGQISVNASAGQAALQLGQSSVATTPFIDFHAGAGNPGYDARLQGLSSGATSGSGTLRLFGTLDIQTVGGTTQGGIYVNQFGPLSGSQAPGIDFNSIVVNQDAANVGDPNGFVTGLRVTLTTGGANSLGSRAAGFFRTNVTSATTNLLPGDYIGLVGQGFASVNMGGTNTGAGAVGTLFGVSPLAVLLSGATNWFIVSGAEVDVGIAAGASARHRLGWDVTAVGTNTGAVLDGALVISAVSAPWINGILLNQIHGSAPLATTGSVIGTDGATATIANFAKFDTYTVTGDVLRFPLVRMTGAGHLTLGAATDLTPLDVVGNTNATHIGRVRNTNAGAAAAAALQLGTNVGDLFTLSANSSANTSFGGANSVNFQNFGTVFTWYTNGTVNQRMKLDNTAGLSVNVNGAVLPTFPGVLQVAAATGSQTGVVADAFANQGAFICRRANGTPTARTALAANDPICSIVALGAYDPISYGNTIGSFTVFAAEAFTATAQGTFSTFGVARPGTTALIEAARLSGVQGVGFLSLAPTLAGSRNGLGVYEVPLFSFGTSGPTEFTHVTGFNVTDTDTTVYTGCVDPNAGGANPSCLNNGAGSFSARVRKNFGAGFGGIGGTLLLETYDTRTDNTSTVEHDQVNLWSTMVNNSGRAVNAINLYPISVRVNTLSSIVGGTIEMVNLTSNDALSHGVIFKAGEEANRQLTEGVLGNAITIYSKNVRSPGSPACSIPGLTCLSGATDAWVKAISLVALDQVTNLWDVAAATGETTINTPAGFTGNALHVKNNSGADGFNVSYLGDLKALTVTVTALAGSGKRGVCVDNAGVLYAGTGVIISGQQVYTCP